VARNLQLVLLAIGAVAASLLASALLATLGVPFGGLTRAPTGEDQLWWNRCAPASFDSGLASVTESTGFGRSFAQLRGPARNPDGNNFDLVDRLQVGWPARSLEGYQYCEQRKSMQQVFLAHPRSAGWYLDAWIPYRPLWPGVVVNAVAFAAAFLLAAFLIGRARRAVRKSRGECVQCGYRLADSRTCPECGSALPSQACVPTRGAG